MLNKIPELRFESPVAVRSTFSIELNGENLEIAALHRKSGENLVFFLHGLGAVKECFEEAFSSGYLSGYSLLSCDLPGFGESTKSGTFSYSMEDFAEVSRLLLNRQDYDSLHIVGHSMGGAIGIILAGLLDGRMRSFVNAEGNLIGDDCGLLSREATRYTLPEFESHGFRKVLAGCSGIENQGMKKWLEWNQNAYVPGFFHSARSLIAWSKGDILLERFKAMKFRKLFAYGSHNSDLKVLGLLDGIETAPVPGSSHAMMIDNPEGFYCLLGGFIAEK
ncbi:MAG: alpha/beta hydrolase [Candidatus Wallbacteria bacterium]|nr:alpha/beta hydrolase [Candidatus Wallbacteria bacterium]